MEEDQYREDQYPNLNSTFKCLNHFHALKNSISSFLRLKMIIFTKALDKFLF